MLYSTIVLFYLTIAYWIYCRFIKVPVPFAIIFTCAQSVQCYQITMVVFCTILRWNKWWEMNRARVNWEPCVYCKQRKWLFWKVSFKHARKLHGAIFVWLVIEVKIKLSFYALDEMSCYGAWCQGVTFTITVFMSIILHDFTLWNTYLLAVYLTYISNCYSKSWHICWLSQQLHDTDELQKGKISTRLGISVCQDP